jgi:hypothetical protein
MPPQFFGKYRGKVASNQDPMNLGRLQVSVPAVLGEGRDSWAMPCVPYAGSQVGFLALPPVGANLWVEFEGGDPDYPIWSGCFWGPGEMPITPALPEIKFFKTNGITLTLSEIDPTRGFTIEVAPPLVPQPLTLKMNADGIKISNGTQIIVNLTQQMIELSNSQQTAVKLEAQSLSLNTGQASVATLAADTVEVKQGTATLKLAASGIELTHNPAAVKVAASGIEVNSSPAKISVAPANIELSNGAGNIKVSPASVNVNNGALEVI